MTNMIQTRFNSFKGMLQDMYQLDERGIGRPICQRARQCIAALVAIVLGACSLSSAKQDDVEMRVAIGREMLAKGNAAAAERILTSVGSDHGATPITGLALADLALARRDLAVAQHHYQAALDQGEGPAAWIGFGRIALARNQPGVARDWFGKALASQPENATAANGLAVAHDLDGDHDRAQSIYRDALAKHPAHVDLRSNLALSLAFRGRTDEATVLLRELGVARRHDANLRQNLALVYMMSARPDEARQLARHDLPDESVETNIALVRRHWRGRPRPSARAG